MTVANFESNPHGFYRTVFTNQALFLFSKLLATIIVVLVLAFEVAAFWLAINRSIYLVLVFFMIVGGGFLLLFLATFPALHPKRNQPGITPADLGITDWEEVRFFTTDDVELYAWFVPPAPKGDGATIVFVHGLGGHRGELLLEAAMLAQHGYGALLVDLRNHGCSQGKMTTLGYAETEDVRSAVQYLLARPEVNSERIGLMGHSMGGATALRAAARIPQVRAIVAQSAYSSIEENVVRGILARAGPAAFLFAPLMVWLGERVTGLRVQQVRPIDDLAQISPRAVLFIHGLQDHTVDTDNSLRLYIAAKEPKELYLIDNVAHKRLMQADPVEYEKRILTFLDRYLCGTAQ